jgi:hypothetical protein
MHTSELSCTKSTLREEHKSIARRQFELLEERLTNGPSWAAR